MGRLSKISNANLRVNYRKLVDEYSAGRDAKIMTGAPEYFSYCCHQCGHEQRLQPEELNCIVGNAFRMAYAAQLQKQSNFQDVITSQMEPTQMDKVLWTKELSTLKQHHAAPAGAEPRVPPATIPGLLGHQHHHQEAQRAGARAQPSPANSDESNSPTELNSCRRIADKPPLIKRIAMGLAGGGGAGAEDSRPLVGGGGGGGDSSSAGSTPGSPTTRPVSGGYINEADEAKHHHLHRPAGPTAQQQSENLRNELAENINANLSRRIELDDGSPRELKGKRLSQLSSSSSGSATPASGGAAENSAQAPTPPPLPERTDSLNNKEEGELRLAPWFQAGIPREIALEVLGREPVGAFLVRESTTKQGCFALSVRVPRSFQPSGIAHYLIVHTNKGYKIKGFTKEFTTLTSLITHHSVMPELLPCTLSLSRYHPNFVKSDSKRDFADIDLDPDYNTLADFRKMMADLNI